jgi:p24 family protein delta-1
MAASLRCFSFLAPIVALLLLAQTSQAIKFNLPSYKYPAAKCIWNAAHPGALVIVTANVGPGEGQRVDVEIIDSSPQKNVYLNKRDIRSETRLAVTAHSEGEVGVCFKNFLDSGALPNRSFTTHIC